MDEIKKRAGPALFPKRAPVGLFVLLVDASAGYASLVVCKSDWDATKRREFCETLQGF